MAEQRELVTQRVRLRLPTAVRQGDVIDVKVKIRHPSRTGLRLVEEAKTPLERFVRERPAVYIETVEVFYGSDRVSVFELNSSTSDDPLLHFKLKADKEGPVRVVAKNNQGETFETTAHIRFSS